MSQQKVAIVTGGSLGIGAAIVRRLAHDGYAVTLDYHTHSDAANAIAQEISGPGRPGAGGSGGRLARA